MGRLSLLQSELTIVLCDDPFIQELNSTWRGKEAPTDVLSFPQAEQAELDAFYDGEPEAISILGDIIISLETVERSFGEHSFQEVERLLIHGIAHLLGHDHITDEEAQQMADFERDLAAMLGTESLTYLEQGLQS